MEVNMKVTIERVGRWMLALYFLFPGIAKFAAWDTHIEMMQATGMLFAPVFLPIAGVVQVAAALLILANRQVAYSALVLAAMIIAINFSLHDFWNFEGLAAQHETQNFVKNLGIFGGMLMLAAYHWPARKHLGDR